MLPPWPWKEWFSFPWLLMVLLLAYLPHLGRSCTQSSEISGGLGPCCAASEDVFGVGSLCTYPMVCGPTHSNYVSQYQYQNISSSCCLSSQECSSLRGVCLHLLWGSLWDSWGQQGVPLAFSSSGWRKPVLLASPHTRGIKGRTSLNSQARVQLWTCSTSRCLTQRNYSSLSHTPMWAGVSQITSAGDNTRNCLWTSQRLTVNRWPR